ncbi:hypothetical protein [Bradyrhizobium sp.]|uniref:hypothetical protein n=1 Tax=Bradyrhizobium sp. TaxID=376 RepID=UPI003BB1E4EB
MNDYEDFFSSSVVVEIVQRVAPDRSTDRIELSIDFFVGTPQMQPLQYACCRSKAGNPYDPRDPFHILDAIRFHKPGLPRHSHFVVFLCGFGRDLPRLMIFSDNRRFEVRGNYPAERTVQSVQSATDGRFRITESLGKRWSPLFKRPFFTLKIVDASTIEVAEGNISTRFFQCSPNSPSL